MADALAWGRRYLMCPPEYFGVRYEINPWMHRDAAPVDADAAWTQWTALRDALRAAGATVVEQPAHPDVPDLVFTANAGIVNGQQFIASRFRHPQRQPETALDLAWFAHAGFAVEEFDGVACNEGAGDALPFRGELVAGHGLRSDVVTHRDLARRTGAPVHSVQLIDPRLYHVDLTFCPLDDRHALIAPMGWDPTGRRCVEKLVPEPLVLEDDEALVFTANSVVVGSTILMPSCPPRVGRQLEAWGFDVAVCPVDEFLKAGGGCRCLTLALDVVLGG